MNLPDDSVRITLRIPGNWAHPGELIERMPEGHRLTPEALLMPDGAEIEFIPMPPDDQFADVFRKSCRRPASAEELAIVDSYTVNVVLTGPGGSLETATQMMRAGAAIINAGGAGVFIDNSALAHGGEGWIEMLEEGSAEAASFAFVSVIRGQREMYTMGMHVLGQREIVMKREDVNENAENFTELIQYMCRGDNPIGDGHLLGDEDGPQFKAMALSSDESQADSPMYNPFGILKLVSMREIAEGN